MVVFDSPAGRVSVSEEAIATIVGVTVGETFGVVGMAPKSLREGITERLNRDQLSKGVEIKQGEHDLLIHAYIIVLYGNNIYEIAKNVQSSIRFAMQKMLGIDAVSVNVSVQGIRFETKDEDKLSPSN